METKLSKTLSYFLRHSPEEAGLEVDDYGFVPLQQLVEALRNRGWEDLTVKKLVDRAKTGGEKRFQVRGSKIRARYGHSFDVNLDREPVDPPAELYHGTSGKAWENIREEGLKPRGRSYVHLSTTMEEAQRVGRRHDSKPIILRVEPPGNSAVSFYRAAKDVVLVREVPPGWLEPLDITR